MGQSESSKNEKVGSRGFKVAVIAAAVSCFIIVVVPIIYNNHLQNETKLQTEEEVSGQQPRKSFRKYDLISLTQCYGSILM